MHRCTALRRSFNYIRKSIHPTYRLFTTDDGGMTKEPWPLGETGSYNAHWQNWSATKTTHKEVLLKEMGIQLRPEQDEYLNSCEKRKMGIVICPLITLIKDQVEKLKAALDRTNSGKNYRVEMLHSNMPPGEQSSVKYAIQRGRVDLLYVAPERLDQAFIENYLVKEDSGRLIGRQISILTIDECHTLYDYKNFRPAMNNWSRIFNWLGRPTLCLVSATVTPHVWDQIQRQWLQRYELSPTNEEPVELVFPPRTEAAEVINKSIKIELLESLQVKANPLRKKATTILNKLRDTDILQKGKFKGTSGVIIYTTTKEDSKGLASYIKELRNEEEGAVLVDYYHAGRGRLERDYVQEQFMKGEIQILVATSAFGMGLDKKDVEAVILANVPNSIATACQMIGRAGRGLEQSRAFIMNCTHSNDRAIHEYLAKKSVPEYSEIKKVLDWFATNDSKNLPEGVDDKEEWLYAKICEDLHMDNFAVVKMVD